MQKPIYIMGLMLASVCTGLLVTNCGEGGIGGPPSSEQLGLGRGAPSTSKAVLAPRSQSDNEVHVFLDMPTRDNPANALHKAVYLDQMFDLDGAVEYRLHVDNKCMVTASLEQDTQGRKLVLLAPQEVFLRSNKKNDYSKGFMCGRLSSGVPKDYTQLAQLEGYTRVVVVAQPQSATSCSPGATDPCRYFNIYVGVDKYDEARIPYKRVGKQHENGHFRLRGPRRVVEGGLGEYALTHTRSNAYRLGEQALEDIDGRLGLFWNPSHNFRAAFEGDDVCNPRSESYGSVDVCLEARGDGVRRLGVQGAPYVSYKQEPFFTSDHKLLLHFQNNQLEGADDDEFKEHFYVGFDPHKSVNDPYRTYDMVAQAFRVKVFDDWGDLFPSSRFKFPGNKKIKKAYKNRHKKKNAFYKHLKRPPVLHDEVLCESQANKLIQRQMPPAQASTGTAPYWYSLRSEASYHLSFNPYYLTIMGYATAEADNCRSQFSYYAVDANFSWARLNFEVVRGSDATVCKKSQKELKKLPKCPTPTPPPAEEEEGEDEEGASEDEDGDNEEPADEDEDEDEDGSGTEGTTSTDDDAPATNP